MTDLYYIFQSLNYILKLNKPNYIGRFCLIKVSPELIEKVNENKAVQRQR